MTASRAKGTQRKRPRNFRLDEKKIQEARRILCTPNDTATIEAALDLVVFRDEALAGIREIGGTGGVADIYDDTAA